MMQVASLPPSLDLPGPDQRRVKEGKESTRKRKRPELCRSFLIVPSSTLLSYPPSLSSYVCLSVCLSVSAPVLCLSVCLSVCLFFCLSVCLSEFLLPVGWLGVPWSFFAFPALKLTHSAAEAIKERKGVRVGGLSCVKKESHAYRQT